eukprot:EG_transcript_7332
MEWISGTTEGFFFHFRKDRLASNPGAAPKPLVLADESTFEDDSAPCPVLAEADAGDWVLLFIYRMHHRKLPQVSHGAKAFLTYPPPQGLCPPGNCPWTSVPTNLSSLGPVSYPVAH